MMDKMDQFIPGVTNAQVDKILSGEIDLWQDNTLFNRLYEHFAASGEMPYGTMKARDGDPAEWILRFLENNI
jgi:hypothetical protein